MERLSDSLTLEQIARKKKEVPVEQNMARASCLMNRRKPK
jgi:hypothetical protein